MHTVYIYMTYIYIHIYVYIYKFICAPRATHHRDTRRGWIHKKKKSKNIYICI